MFINKSPIIADPNTCITIVIFSNIIKLWCNYYFTKSVTNTIKSITIFVNF